MPILDQPGLFYPDLIAQHARFEANKPAVICEDEQLTWAQLDRRTNKVAHALRGLGLKKGDKVCLFMQSSVAMFELLWGTVKAGCVTVPLNVMMAGESLALMANNCEGAVLFADASTWGQVEAVRSQLRKLGDGTLFAVGHSGPGWRSAEQIIDAAFDTEIPHDLEMTDSMTIIYSSGSTGVPKGIEHSHFARLAYACGTGPAMGIDRYTVAIATTPLYTNGTMITMLPTVYWGGTTVLLKKFSAKAYLEAVQRHRCTHVFMVPTQYIAICAENDFDRYDTRSMQVHLTGGQPLPSSVFDELTVKFPAAGIHEIYGMTEGFLVMASPKDWAHGKRGSVGKPIFGADIHVIDADGNILPAGATGELAAWGPALMKGYYNDLARTRDSIWIGPHGRTFLRSGDIGHIDEDGFTFISGRVKDMIKSGGLNIFASDIEEVFMRHPEVKEAAAVGIPHEKWGETPLLFVILHEGATVSPIELMAWGNAKLGNFQRVSGIEVRSDFPRATHDKVPKRALRDPYWKQSG